MLTDLEAVFRSLNGILVTKIERWVTFPDLLLRPKDPNL